MSDHISVGLKRPNSEALFGLSVNMRVTRGLPTVIVVGGTAFVFDTFDDDGTPIYEARQTYVYNNDDLPNTDFLLPARR